MAFSLRRRAILSILSIVALYLICTSFYMDRGLFGNIRDIMSKPASPESKPVSKPKYKATPSISSEPIVDNFPRAMTAHSPADLPPIPSWNLPSNRPRPENTSLFIGFTRNWRLLQQAVVSYITAGWPPSQIYVVENTGTMLSNKNGQLSLQNPFFLNHTRLELLQVNVIITPTLLTFAQLQNFYLWTALQRNYTTYFWAHMDTCVLVHEEAYDGSNPHPSPQEFHSVYDHGLKALSTLPPFNAETGEISPWGVIFFAYDYLSLVNTAAYDALGGWDTGIPFYATDCDFHFRLEESRYPPTEEFANVVTIMDVADSLDDLEVLYRKKDGPRAEFTLLPEWREELDRQIAEEKRMKEKEEEEKAAADKQSEELATAERATTQKDTQGNDLTTRNFPNDQDDTIASPTYHQLLSTLRSMNHAKSALGRLRWQTRQNGGGEGEPYYRDPEGFQISLDKMINVGKDVYAEKWGHRGCDLPKDVRAVDAWRLEHDNSWG